MRSDLNFLPDNLAASDDFKRVWWFAVSTVHRMTKRDCDLGTSAEKKLIQQAFDETFSAAYLLRNELDSGVLADHVELDDFANEYGFSSDEIQTVRRFLHTLLQDVLIKRADAIGRIPKKHRKSAPSTAAYFVGRLCCQFNLGKPTDYASASYEKESVAISLLRCLLVEAKEDRTPSLGKMRGLIKVAKEGYKSYKPKMYG